MPRTVTFDTLELDGVNLWVDFGSGALEAQAYFTLASSVDGVRVQRARRVEGLLSAQDTQALVDIITRLRQALELEELA